MTSANAQRNLIEIRNLSVTFPSEAGIVRAVRDVSLDIRAGEVLGIVGESGSGKTVMSLSMIGLLAESASITGSISYNGVNLLDLNDNEMSKYRGKDIAMVFHDRPTNCRGTPHSFRHLEGRRVEACRRAVGDRRHSTAGRTRTVVPA